MKLVSMQIWQAAILLNISMGSVALASGGMEGGGGKTVICRNPDQSIRTAEVLDLYEGRTIHKLSYVESTKNWKLQVKEFLQAAGVPTYKSSPPDGVYDWFLNALDYMTILPDGTSLKPIDDSLEAIIPDGCALEQTVNYQNDRLILVHGKIWKALSETQKAALIIHEATYRLLRGYGEKDSRRARHFTAHIVSGGKIEATYPGNGFSLVCGGGTSGKVSSFYVTKLPQSSSGEPEKLRLQFIFFGGRKMMSKAYVDVDIKFAGVPEVNLLEQLKNPSHWLRVGDLTLDSLFQPGDTFDLWFHPEEDGKWVVDLQGTSIVDGSAVDLVKISCFPSF